MKREWLATLLVGIAGIASCALGACGSSSSPPACSALQACCANLGGATSSCTATASEGELDDAGCGEELAMYQANGQCPATPVADAAHD